MSKEELNQALRTYGHLKGSGGVNIDTIVEGLGFRYHCSGIYIYTYILLRIV